MEKNREGDIWEASGGTWRHLRGIWRHLEASERHLRDIWEASGRQLELSWLWLIWERKHGKTTCFYLLLGGAPAAGGKNHLLRSMFKNHAFLPGNRPARRLADPYQDRQAPYNSSCLGK